MPLSVRFKSDAPKLEVVASQSFVFVLLSVDAFRRTRVKRDYDADHGCCFGVPLLSSWVFYLSFLSIRYWFWSFEKRAPYSVLPTASRGM